MSQNIYLYICVLGIYLTSFVFLVQDAGFLPFLANYSPSHSFASMAQYHKLHYSVLGTCLASFMFFPPTSYFDIMLCTTTFLTTFSLWLLDRTLRI